MNILFIDNKRTIVFAFSRKYIYRFLMPWPWRFYLAYKYWFAHVVDWADVNI